MGKNWVLCGSRTGTGETAFDRDRASVGAGPFLLQM